MKYYLTNFVRGTLLSAISDSDVELTITIASGPFVAAGVSGFGLQPSVLTLVDDLVAPTKAEIITFTSVNDNGDGTWTIFDAVRGAEGSTAQSWSANDPVYQSATAGAFDPPANWYFDWNAGYFGINIAPLVDFHVQGAVRLDGQVRVTQLRHAAEVDVGSLSGAETVSWSSANHQKGTLNGSTTFTFNTPGGPATLVLKITSGGAYPITWPSNVRWVGNVTPVHSTVAGRVDIFEFYFDGATYWGSAKIGFVP